MGKGVAEYALEARKSFFIYLALAKRLGLSAPLLLSEPVAGWGTVCER